MTNQEFKEWRSKEISRVGLQAQLKGEAKLEKDRAQPLVKVCDEKSGMYKLSKPDVTAVMTARGEYSKSKSYFIP